MKLILLMAVTADGKIGKSADHFPDWTGRSDKKRFVEITRRAGALIMGSRTYDTIGSPLPHRKNVVLTRNPDRVSHEKNLVFTHLAPGDLLASLEAEGFSEVILAGGASVNTLFAEQGLIDGIVVTVSPKIFGTGLSLFSGPLDMDLNLVDVERLGPDRVCLTYNVIK